MKKNVSVPNINTIIHISRQNCYIHFSENTKQSNFLELNVFQKGLYIISSNNSLIVLTVNWKEDKQIYEDKYM